MRGHADRRKATIAATEAHLEMRRGRTAQRVDERIGLVLLAGLVGEHEHQVRVPVDLGGHHPERVERDLVGRLLVGRRLGIGRSHLERAGRNRRHAERRGGVGNGHGVGLGRLRRPWPSRGSGPGSSRRRPFPWGRSPARRVPPPAGGWRPGRSPPRPRGPGRPHAARRAVMVRRPSCVPGWRGPGPRTWRSCPSPAAAG